MKYVIFCLVQQLIWNQVYTQNLIPNPSFEDFVKCPTYSNTQHSAFQVGFGPLCWVQPISASPDYLNNCSDNIYCSIPDNLYGRQYPKTGSAYVGIVMHSGYKKKYREFIQCKLVQPLDSSGWYKFSFYLSKAEFSKFELDRIHCLFSIDSVSRGESEFGFESGKDSSSFTWLNFHLDKVQNESDHWIRLSSVFQAKGREQFVTVGNFDHLKKYKKQITKDNRSKRQRFAYYYLDNFSLIKCQENEAAPVFLLSDTLSFNELKTTFDEIKDSLKYYIEMYPEAEFQFRVNAHPIELQQAGFWFLYDQFSKDKILLPKMLGDDEDIHLFFDHLSMQKKFKFKQSDKMIININSVVEAPN